MLTSRDLLYNAFDYDGFWNTSNRMKSSESSQCRLLQIEKLMAALGISKANAKFETQRTSDGKNLIIEYIHITSGRGKSKSMNRPQYIKSLTNFKYFTSGEFIDDVEKIKYEQLNGQIISTLKTLFPEQINIIDKEPLRLNLLFQNLYNFRLSVYHMIKYSYGAKTMKDFSPEDEYSFYLRNKFINSMHNNLTEVDDILCLLIDPEKRTFSEEEINYPTFDFKTMDEEWLKSNRS